MLLALLPPPQGAGALCIACSGKADGAWGWLSLSRRLADVRLAIREKEAPVETAGSTPPSPSNDQYHEKGGAGASVCFRAG